MTKLTPTQKQTLLSGINSDITFDELEQIDSLNVDDQVDYCKVLVEELEAVEDVEKLVDNINQSYQESINEKPLKFVKTLFSALISFAFFYFLFDKDLIFAGAIITVILIHELGHFIMQKIYLFSNVSMAFTPFGAYVSGISKTNSSSENFWVYIMGPLPGILIGLFLFFFYFYNYQPSNEPAPFILAFVIMSLIINAINLFPAGFLDGGRIFSICFDRYPRFSWLMSILLYIPLIFIFGRDLLSNFKDGNILWSVVLSVPLILFILHFRSLLNNKISIIKRESVKLSNFLIARYGSVPNKIDYDTACYLLYKSAKTEYKISILDIWLDRSVPLTNSLRKLYILIYFSLLSISIFMYSTLFIEPQNGYGTHTNYFNGSDYTGEWKDGKEHGEGTYTWANGNTYTGNFINGQRTGKGTFTWANDDKYTGDFIDGHRTGKGTLTWENGDKYTGDFIDGYRTGQGTYTWADGDTYTGQFLRGEIVE